MPTAFSGILTFLVTRKLLNPNDIDDIIDMDEILEEKKDWITGKELSTILSVSDRTIRNDIDQLGKLYEGIVESSVRFSGFLTGDNQI